MSDNWPAQTPREEMLARVAARGTRIRAVRGAVNALVVLSVVGASALGVGTVIGGLGDGQGTEVENIAMVPDPPDGNPVPSQSSDAPSTTGDGTTSTGDPGSVPDGGEVASPTSGAAQGGGSGTATPGSSGPTVPGSTTAPRRPTTTTGSSTTVPSTTTEPTTTSTAVPAPLVGAMRAKVDGGVSTGDSLCAVPSAVIAVDIENADSATVTWNRAGESRSAELTAGAAEWSAPITEIDETSADVPLVVTVTATGPGGTTSSSTTIPVADCTPLSPDPSAQGS